MEEEEEAQPTETEPQNFGWQLVGEALGVLGPVTAQPQHAACAIQHARHATSRDRRRLIETQQEHYHEQTRRGRGCAGEPQQSRGEQRALTLMSNGKRILDATPKAVLVM